MVALEEIRLTNFKSVRESKVDLRPLTAIVGRNSSGKSTLLQSVLALAQAVRRNFASEAFPLNGDLVRLGSFDEVRNFDAGADDRIGLGFKAQVEYRLHRRSGPILTIPGTVDWDVRLQAPSGETGLGHAVIEAIEFGLQSTDEADPVDLRLSATNIRGNTIQAPLPDRPMRFFGGRLEDLQVDGQLTDERSGEVANVDLMSISGGLPVAAFRLDTRFNVRFRYWWDAVTDLLEPQLEDSMPTIFGDDPVAWAIDFAAESMIDEESVDREAMPPGGVRRPRSGDDLFRFSMLISQLEKVDKKRLEGCLAKVSRDEFGNRLRTALVHRGVTWLEEVVRDEPTTDLHHLLDRSTYETYALFHSVLYLGPLRAKPQVMYSPGSGQPDLGPEGELAAAYLHQNASARTQVPLPGGGHRAMPLGEGLNLWLEELGLADGAVTQDRGRLGIGLYVQPVGRQQQVDLTSVGVGVSQALPVVLLCLLARPGSVILLEQPELHLHPAMQLRLADFLLACAGTGRQIIVETHSEHLINRLRYHVAADETSQTAETVRLLFAEQEGGETVYRISDINELGGLENDWPKGFLDVAAEESSRLLQQTLAKRRTLTSDGG
jgi:energy-coupling factor transporter ATP-binding protein EcfA2